MSPVGLIQVGLLQVVLIQVGLIQALTSSVSHVSRDAAREATSSKAELTPSPK